MSLTGRSRRASLHPRLGTSEVLNAHGERPFAMYLKRSLGLAAALAMTFTLAACGSDSSSSSASGGNYGDCKVTSKKGSISIKPAKAGTLTVETTLPAQGW